MFGRNSTEMKQEPEELTVEVSPPSEPTPPPEPESGDIIAFVGEEVTFKGTIRYQGTVRVDGTLEGEIYTDGNLIIGQKAVINARIQAGNITCQGRITGEIEAKTRVQLVSPAVIDGAITTPLLSMDEGVQFNGTCNMPKKGERKSKEPKLVVSVEEAVKVQ